MRSRRRPEESAFPYTIHSVLQGKIFSGETGMSRWQPRIKKELTMRPGTGQWFPGKDGGNLPFDAGIGLVERDYIALRLQLGRREPRQLPAAGGSEPVAKDEVGAPAAMVGDWVRRHGVAVDQHG